MSVHYAVLCVCAHTMPQPLTRKVLQDEVQLAPCLEGIDEVHYEWVLHLLQDIPLCLGVSSVLSVTHYHGLEGSNKAWIVKHCQYYNNGSTLHSQQRTKW